MEWATYVIDPILQIGRWVVNQWKEFAEAILAGGKARHQIQELPVPLHRLFIPTEHMSLREQKTPDTELLSWPWSPRH